VAVIVYLLVYTRVTPHDEFGLIGKNVPGVAISWAEPAWFCAAGRERRCHAADIVDCAIWSLIALAVQIVAYYVAQIPVSDLAKRIAAGELAAAIWLGLASLTAGLLSAAAMTL
jgi:putative membrane protein